MKQQQLKSIDRGMVKMIIIADFVGKDPTEQSHCFDTYTKCMAGQMAVDASRFPKLWSLAR